MSSGPPFVDLPTQVAGKYAPGRIQSLPVHARLEDDPFSPFNHPDLEFGDGSNHRSLYDFHRSKSHSKSAQPVPERSLLFAPSPASAAARPPAGFMLGDGAADTPNILLKMSGLSPPSTSSEGQQPKDPPISTTGAAPSSAASARASRAALQPPAASSSTQPGQSQFVRRQQSHTQRQPHFAHAYSAPPASPSQDAQLAASAIPASLSYPGSAAYGSAPSPFGVRSGFVPSYSMSPQQPAMNIIHSPHQYAYTPHGPMHGHDASIQFSSPSYTSVVHAPMFNPYGDPAASQPLPYTTAGPSSMTLYAPSPPPLSPNNQSHQSFQTQPPYGYSGAGYSGAHFAYAPPSTFAHGRGMYQSFGHSPYGQQAQQRSYPGSNEQDGQGTWWYMPNSSTPYDQTSFQTPYFSQQQPGRRVDEATGAQSQTSASELPPQSSPSTPAKASRRQPAQTPQPRLTVTREATALSPTSSAPTAPLSPAPALPAAPALQSVKSAPTSSVSDRMDPSHGRKSYHPNPPAQRSEWVMWAGNVPSDATHDELWRFFNQAPAVSDGLPSLNTGAAPVHGGVSSIFLISRSNCAFVNFETEAHLEAATQRFNGQPLRPADPRCPRLVCRVRRKTDDLKAGVGGQRGMGMHTRWVREQRARAANAIDQSASSPDGDIVAHFDGLSLSEDDGDRAKDVFAHTSSSSSFSSSNSSFLQKYFPERYFILKSLTQYDLDLSVQKGVWATQRHNEGILDQAFRTSKDVFLIFGVNKSGEFYGYARMVSGVQQSEDRIPWEARSPGSAGGGGGNNQPILSPGENRFADASPQPFSGVTPGATRTSPPVSKSSGALLSPEVVQPGRQPHASTAPPEMGEPHHQLSHQDLPPGHNSLNVHPIVPPTQVPATNIELDTTAPLRAVRNPSPEALIRAPLAPVKEVPSQEHLPHHPQRPEPVPIQHSSQPHDEPAEDEPWGRSFKIEWIRTDRLPFFRTRNLRNPWNHGREVKVSRDGTELEPSVGRELLAEWNRPPPDAREAKPPGGSSARRGARAAPAPPPPP